MNTIQSSGIEQILPQAQNYTKKQDTGGLSFSDALKEADRALDDAEKTAENAQEQKPSEAAVDSGRPEPDKAELSSAEKNKSEKSDKKTARFSDTDAENVPVCPVISFVGNPNVADMTERVSSEAAVTAELNPAAENVNPGARGLADEPEIDDAVLSWLLSSKKDSGEKSAETETDFASLIDGAEEFVPGNESEQEKLERAQNLVLSDPELFLQEISGEVSEKEGLSKSGKETVIPAENGRDAKAKKSDVRFSVHDLRTERADIPQSGSELPVQKTDEKKSLSFSMQQQNENTVSVTMELASNVQQNMTASSSQAAAASGSDFQYMLSQAVQESAPDFVKAGSIVLKDNNHGTIQLVLRPENLGNVKISLNLADKLISGQITVQTREAFEAFRESIGSLREAFAQSGFDTGSFDLQFSSQQNFAQGGNGANQQNAGYMAERVYGDFVSSGESAQSEGHPGKTFSDGESYSVNIVA